MRFEGLQRLRPWFVGAGLAGALAVAIAARLVAASAGRDAVRVFPFEDPSIVELNKSLYSPGDPVPAIYGQPVPEPVRVLFLPEERFIRPSEDPSLLLLPVKHGETGYALQDKTFLLFANAASLGLAGAGLLALLIPRRRRAPNPSKAESDGRHDDEGGGKPGGG
ncbi:MAG: hypothetical protein SF028_14980 [Candidatus Sumerlaeia bacterium]|nr:hypothetical protein [Candidatus Sumerlaeia bacterium]